MGCAISKGQGRVSAAAAASSTSEWISGRDAAKPSVDELGSSCRGSFHVFISFRGPDVRNTLLAHLHHALVREGIHAYVDHEDLRCGDHITLSLKKAIQDSRMAVIIFSENYASSRWCLDELTEIMNRSKQAKLVVKPVFYRVEPRELRTPRYSFAEALAAHELKLGKDSGMLRRWREVLFEAGNLSGWHLDENGNEAELIRNIVKDVNVLIDCPPLDVAKYPVGIKPQAGEIENMLNVESDEVLLVGLWGMAGIGKTTLAKAIFNSFANQFDGCAFLPNVREESANSSAGLAKLQEKLLSEVLGRKDVTIGSIARGITLIKDRLCQKKVLLLLDDISSTDQLDVLAGGLDWFGNGSRILVTTRDRSLLRTRSEDIVYKVEGLPYNQALQLFSKHAFPENDRASIAEDLIDRCLAYCAGLPLALVKLGSLLRNREERHWRSTLKLLEQGPCEEIDKVLRVSFNELDLNSKEILLHIACFFKGKCRRDIEKAMDACGFETSLGIDRLIERSLITIVKDTTCGSSVERVEMHPLFQLMCCNIVCQGSPDEHGNRSRRWVYEGTRSVLSNGKGTNIVKGLALRSPHPKEMHFRGDTFTNFKKSRRLIMGNVHYVGDPMCFPTELPWIECSGYSVPNTLFCWPRKFKVQNSVCCKGKRIFHLSLRVPLDYHSRCNRKVALSVDESRLRFPPGRKLPNRLQPSHSLKSLLVHTG